MEFPRLISQAITRLLSKNKIILISGPRQVGKTFLSQRLLHSESQTYLNFDDTEDRRIIMGQLWPKDSKTLILDELHKMKNWKTWLKAIYDKESVRPHIIVTGSARMETFKKGGDSLAGRHFHFRLHPLMLQEIKESPWPSSTLVQRFIDCGGFPEPFVEGDPAYSKIWQKSHLDRIIKDDLLDLEKVRELKKIEILTQLLAEQVGSRISYSSLARSLEVSPNTIKHWLQILEDLYVIFKVQPFTRGFSSAILKAPKYYFFDTSRVYGDFGAKLENFMACQLLAQIHLLEDSQGERMSLSYVANKQGHEVDFAILRNYKVECLVEVKSSESHLSSSLKYFSGQLKPKESLQAVYNLKQEQQYGSLKIVSIEKSLNDLFRKYFQ